MCVLFVVARALVSASVVLVEFLEEFSVQQWKHGSSQKLVFAGNHVCSFLLSSFTLFF